MRNWRRSRILSITLCIIVSILSGCSININQTLLSDQTAAKALSYAVSRIDSLYVFGARGPEQFDCSGLIVWSYKQVYPNLKLRIVNRLVEDANINEIYKYNVEPVLVDNLIGGEIIFITDSESKVTHGALFIRRIDSDNIEIVHASSKAGKVVIEPWPLERKVRDQWFVGAGRLMTAY